MKRVACLIALAGTTLIAGAPAPTAHADPIPAKGLQLSVPASSIFTNDAVTKLDLHFRGGDIRAIEMFLDGFFLKKQDLETSGGRGIVAFALDGLADGLHTLIVRAQDGQGNWVTTTTKFRVSPSKYDPFIKAIYPSRGEMVQGNVPVKLDLSENIRNPYVSFSVDDEWLAIMNYAPFTYNWDTTKVPNGLHTIIADIFDDATKVKTVKIQVNVNNSGGFTNIQRDTPNLANRIVKSVILETAGAFASPIQGELKSVNRLQSVTDDALNLGSIRSHAAKKPSAKFQRNRFAARPDNRPLLDNGSTLRDAAPGAFGLLSRPAEIAGLSGGKTLKTRFFANTLQPQRMGNIAIRPSLSYRVNEAKLFAAYAPNIIAKRGAFNVLFDNTMIKFDVAPRIENGVPLAPFRQIFEYSGGSVTWENLTKTVTAEKDSLSAKFTVGSREAQVNQKTVKMEATPYIDGSRAIVPLSFIGNLLDVQISFEPKTGRVFIESRKFAAK